MPRSHFAMALVALALAVAGCKATATSGSCRAGSPVCYELPAGFVQKGDPVERPDLFSIAYADESKGRVEFIVRDLDGFDVRWKALQGNAKAAKATDVREEDLAGGKGKLLTYSTPEKEPRFIVATMLRGAKKSIECVGEYRTSVPRPAVVDACKSAREP